MSSLKFISDGVIEELEKTEGNKLTGFNFHLDVSMDPLDLERDGEPSSSMMYFHGKIQLLHPELFDPIGVVGTMEFAIADFREDNLFFVLDGDADDNVYTQLFEDDGLAPATRRALGLRESVIDVERLLILHRLSILPEARGRKLGAMVIDQVIYKFGGGCDLVAMVCRPLQLNDRESESARRMGLDVLTTDKSKATKKLASYYRRMGFKSVIGNKDNIMVKLP